MDYRRRSHHLDRLHPRIGGMRIHGAQEVNIEQAYIAGKWAREAGRGIDSCPTYAMGAQGAPYRNEWRRGWKDADEQIRRKA